MNFGLPYSYELVMKDELFSLIKEVWILKTFASSQDDQQVVKDGKVLWYVPIGNS